MKHIDTTQMSDILCSAREAKKLTQATLTEKIDVSKRTIIAVEQNQFIRKLLINPAVSKDMDGETK